MKKNLSRLISIVCLLGLMVTGGFAQGLNSAPPSPVVVNGTLITVNIPTVIKTEYLAQEATRNESVEESASWTTAENRMLLLEATYEAYRRNPDLEQAVVRAYTRYAEHLGRNLSTFNNDADFQFLVALLTQ